jgi:hypothetical protein
MATYRECLARINLLLGEPHPAYPSEPIIWRYMADAAQLLFQQAMFPVKIHINWRRVILVKTCWLKQLIRLT